MAEAPFTPSEEEQRLIHQVALAKEVVAAAAPAPRREGLLYSDKAFGVLGVLLGGMLTLVGGWCSQSAASKENREERALGQAEQARKERLEVALQAQRQVAAALAGCDKLAFVAQGRFDGDVDGGRAMTEAANLAAETWRRESEALDLSFRLRYGPSSPARVRWKALDDDVDAYIREVEAFYLDWRAGAFRQDKDGQALRASACSAKRQAVAEALDTFGAALAPGDLIPGPSRVEGQAVLSAPGKR